MESGESRSLVANVEYRGIKDSDGENYFIVQPCVGGMVSGVQVKWRIFVNDEDRGVVVMNGLPFRAFDDELFIINHSKDEGYTITLT